MEGHPVVSLAVDVMLDVVLSVSLWAAVAGIYNCVCQYWPHHTPLCYPSTLSSTWGWLQKWKRTENGKFHSGSFITYNKIWPFFQFFKKYLYSIFAEAFWLLTIMQKDVDRDIEKIVPKEKKVNENKTVKNSVSIDRKKMLKE